MERVIIDNNSRYFADFKGIGPEFLREVEKLGFNRLTPLGDIRKSKGFDCFHWNPSARGQRFWSGLQKEYLDWEREGCPELTQPPPPVGIDWI